MLIYDPISKKTMAHVTIFLTPDEAMELVTTVNALVAEPNQHHGHVCNAEYSCEVTVAVYTASNLSGFDAESRALLEIERRSS